MSEFILISIEKIPDWLKDSIFYQNLDKEDISISIPKDKLENEIKINNINDLYKYLEIVRYWMIINCPHEIYNFIKLNRIIIDLSYIKTRFYDLPFLDEFEILCSIENNNNKYFICNKASEKRYLNLLKYAHENGCPWDKYTCYSAAFNGHLECLKYAHENGCPWDKYTCSFAAQKGHLDCLKYAHENGCPWDEDTCSNAAQNGHLDCLKYADENYCYWNQDICASAAKNGHLDCLKYAHENYCPGYKKYIK
jgi:hypothetical protein